MTAKEKRRLAALERRVAELEKATAIFKDAESVMVLTDAECCRWMWHAGNDDADYAQKSDADCIHYRG